MEGKGVKGSTRKPSDLLLAVNPKERQDAQAFVDDRLKNLDVKLLPRLQELAQASRAQMAYLQRERERMGAPGDPAARAVAKLYEASLSGMADIVTLCMRTVRLKVQELKEMKRQLVTPAGAADSPPNQEEVDAFLIPCSPDEEADALRSLTDRVEELDAGALKELRETCQVLIAWWESEAGQMDGLKVSQYGSLLTGQGRSAIRTVREDFRRETFALLRSFYREVNSRYQLKAIDM